MAARRLYLRTAVLLGGTFFVGAILPTSGQATNKPLASPLRATIALISEGYCLNSYQERSNDRFGSLAFLVHLEIRNVSDHRVILCRKCIESADEPTLWLANPDGSPGQIRNGGMQFDAFGVDPPRKDPGSPDKNYVTLNPGEHLDADYRTGILVTYDPPPGLRTTLHSGDYRLQVKFQSWQVEKADTSKLLRDWWKAYGDLYTGILAPAPLPVRVDVPAVLSPCPVNK
jgi:hypothetical protein